MSSLSVFKSDNGIEIIINQQTGESFCSVSGYARMSGLSQPAITKRVKKLDNSNLVKNAEIDTGYGVKLHNLLTEDLITDWIVDDNPAMAKQLLKAGVRIFLHKLAGYKVTSKAVQVQPQTSAEMFLMVAQQLVEQERKTKELEAKLLRIETAQQEAIASLDEIPNPEVEAEELTTRAKLNRLVRDYSAANAVHFQEVWRRVYREFRDRYHIDLKQRTKNIRAAGGKKFSALDVCEQLGKIEELYAVAFDLLKA